MRILGINPFHDSSVAVFTDGNIEFFSKEERLSRIKRDKHPFISLDTAISSVGAIDAVAICAPTNLDGAIHTYYQYVNKQLKVPEIVNLSNEHHLQHAALAFYNSGFEESLVIVADRNGSFIGLNARESETVFVASYPNSFTPIYKNLWLEDSTKKPESVRDIEEKFKNYKTKIGIHVDSQQGLVKVYESATTLIGQHVLENGKTMGLAAYGEDNLNFPKLFSNFGVGIDQFFFHKNNYDMDYACYSSLKKHLLKTPMTEKNYKEFANYAFQVQKQSQEAMLELITSSVTSTGITNVCVTGGYGLNVVANAFYIENLPNVNFYFEPLADDSGNSIGGAMYVYRSMTQDLKINKLKHTFFNGTLDTKTTNYGKPCSPIDIAKYIVEGKSVAIFNGLAEAGPRALGNRSILFDPRNPEAKKIVNKIKKREWYRPFAAAVLKEDANKYFYMPIEESPFMTVSFKSLPESKNVIPGVIHVDNTCRIQTVTYESGPIYDVLLAFKELTGHGILLNTSFNLAGEPLVQTFDEAVEVLETSELDILWLPKAEKYLTKG
jgi:carbamoyltransferase